MRQKSLIVFCVIAAFVRLALLPQQAMATESLSGILFRCLQEKWPDIQSTGGGRHVFIPETGQNLAWDKDKGAWIDTKTLQPVRGPCTLPGAVFKYCLQEKWPDIQSTGGGRHVFVPETGQNLAWDKDKQAWIDVKTGKCICPECPPSRTAEAPTTPPPTEHVLRTQPDPFELEFGYNYINAPDEEEVKNLHGFNASLFVNVNSWLAFGGEFAAGFGDESFRNLIFEDVDISLDRYLYLFGPRVSVRPTERLRIYAQAMVGGVHDHTEVTFTGAGRSVTNSNSADAWAFDFGVGADWRFTNHWSWRIIQADYLATTFSSFNNDHWQDNWRLSTGIVFSFGGKEPPRQNDYSKERPIHAK